MRVAPVMPAAEPDWRAGFRYNDFSKRFPKSHPHRQSVEFFSRELIGANALEVYLTSSQPKQLLEPSTLAAIDRLDQRIRRLPQVESAASLTSLLREACRLMELDSGSGLPPSRVAAEGLLRLAAASGAGVESLVLPQQGMTRLLVRVAPTRLFQMLDVARQVERLGDQLPAGVDVDVTRMYPIIGRAATAVINNHVKGLFICFACVMTLLAVGLRSLRLSVLAVAPNLLPLCLLAGALGLTVGMVDADALGIAVVSFGLAVDDTSHFLHRYDIELARENWPRRALQNTFDSGQAIVRTTLILGIGLSPFALSGYLSVLGTYLVLVLACAVLGDLLLLPATILLLAKERGSTP